MKKRMICMGLFVSLVFLGGTAFAKASGPYSMGRTFEATSLIGQRVNGRGGNYIGEISNLVADQSNDRVALVVLSNISGLGAGKVAIPYDCLERTGKDTFEVSFPNIPDIGIGSADSSKDLDLYFLTRAPEGSELYGVPYSMNARWVADVYRHYGQVPYWTEKGGGLQPSWTIEGRQAKRLDFYRWGGEAQDF